jgi:hypothetical protein
MKSRGQVKVSSVKKVLIILAVIIGLVVIIIAGIIQMKKN